MMKLNRRKAIGERTNCNREKDVMTRQATTSASSSSVINKIERTLYAITFYNGRRRLPTSGMTMVKREKKEDTVPSQPIIENAGWIAGLQIASFLFYTGCDVQLVETEQGGKFEFFFQSDSPNDDCWLTGEQIKELLDSMSMQRFGVRAVYENSQGCMLVVTPVSDGTADLVGPTDIELTVGGDEVIMQVPAGK